MSYMGIVSPVVGVVRFWPAVIVPAIFATLFGPWVGGIGAAIGIFLSDMTYGHQIALLSLFAGVPSNFLGFFILGYIANKNLKWKHVVLGVIGIIILIALIGYLNYAGIILTDIFAIFAGMSVLACLAMIIAVLKFPKWKSFELGSIAGLLFGASWIGATLVIYSIFLPLPLTFEPYTRNAPFYAGILWIAWTFCSEIPFLVFLGPPILESCFRAFPSLVSYEKKEPKC